MIIWKTEDSSRSKKTGNVYFERTNMMTDMKQSTQFFKLELDIVVCCNFTPKKKKQGKEENVATDKYVTGE